MTAPVSNRWWRIHAMRGDYDYGGLASYEQEEDARAAARKINEARSPRLIRAGFVFVVVQDGNSQPIPLDQERILGWAERLIG